MKRKRQSADAIQDRLNIIHNFQVTVDKNSYSKVKQKCIFVDVEFGEFVAIPNNVLRGSCHPKRANQNRENTCLKRFGVKHVFQSEVVKNKLRETWLANYGVENPFQSDVIKHRIYENNFERYGFKSPMQRAEIKCKVAQTNLNRYGFSVSSKAESVKEKSRQTCLRTWGCENVMQNHDILVKALRSGKKLKLLHHWKTGLQIVCTASYEFAFVNWCNANKIDFDWQISHKMPNGNTYVIDAFIKDGEFANTWIEIKGWFRTKKNHDKWKWFHNEHPQDSELWNLEVLNKNEILLSGKPNEKFYKDDNSTAA